MDPKQQTSLALSHPHSSKRKRRHINRLDDTPKAFKRLMALQEGIRPRHGLDDGNQPPRKRQDFQGNGVKKIETGHVQSQLARGNVQHDRSSNHQPANLSQTTDKVPSSTQLGKVVKNPRSRREKKMLNIKNEWKRAEAFRKARAEEAREAAEDQDPCADFWQTMAARSRRARLKQSREAQGWTRQSKTTRPSKPSMSRKVSASGLVGLHDIVQEPPQLPTLTRFRLLSLESHRGVNITGIT